MPELTQAQRDVLTDEERDWHKQATGIRNIPNASTGSWVDVSHALLESLADARIKSEARRNKLEIFPLGRILCIQCDEWDHNCGCDPSILTRTRAKLLEE